ncbi:MAG: potassium channel family protein [Caldilineaceae bacterium]|nr:potassium channel family protein [Caldilineaceae bacterium]
MSEQRADASSPQPYDIFILVATLISIGATGYFYLAQPNSEHTRMAFLADGLFSVIFLIDFAVTLGRAPDRKAYLKWGWIDLLGSLPALPWLRPFRLVRVVRILGRAHRRELLRMVIQDRADSVLWATSTVVLITLVVSSALILPIERVAPSANITTAEDALWWAFVTITTVGYGDRYPVTGLGRLMAAVLMTVGVGLFGVLSSYLAAQFLASADRPSENELAAIRQELAEIKQALAEITNGTRNNSLD